MTDTTDARKKKIAELKEKLAKQVAAAPKDAKKGTDAVARKLRKHLKREQRHLARSVSLTLEERLKFTQKRLDQTGKLLTDMTKGMKKVQGDPYVHSLRKRTKSLNKRLKKINRTIEKQKKSAAPAPAAPAAPPPAAT